jgi:hypothetical protein
MFHNNAQALVHTPGNPAPSAEAQLPRGECAFIESEGSGSRQRCMCRSFYPDSVVRSRCGCGHQAWHHEAQPPSTVTMDEYAQVVEQMKRLRQEVRRLESLEQNWKQELFKERMAREELMRTSRVVEARMYENMQFLKISMDDRVEAVVDKTTEFSDQIKGMQERLTMLDDVSMELENRVDRVEHFGGLARDATPVASTPRDSQTDTCSTASASHAVATTAAPPPWPTSHTDRQEVPVVVERPRHFCVTQVAAVRLRPRQQWLQTMRIAQIAAEY